VNVAVLTTAAWLRLIRKPMPVALLLYEPFVTTRVLTTVDEYRCYQ